MRGVGWDFGTYVPIPRSNRPAERQAYIRATIKDIVRNVLLVDVLDTAVKQVPGITATGGSIFLQELPPLQRYALSTILHISHGLMVYAGVCNVYDITSLIGVVLFHQSPSLWPPICGSLLEARSLHGFWAKAWHQSFRYTFLTLGGFFGRWFAGSIGMVFGCFLASGLFHEFGLIAAGKELDMRVVVFFLLQAVGILLEKAFSALTGRKVGGWPGFLWTAVFILGFGQICTFDLTGLAALAGCAKSIHFAVVPEGTLKLGEEDLWDSQEQANKSPAESIKQRGRFPSWLSDAIEVGITARGLGWKFGRGVHVPKARRSSERSAYLKRTASSVIRTLLLVDLFDSFLETLPGMTVQSGTIFFPDLPPITRYLVSTLLHLCTGITVIYGLEMWYDIASLIGVGLFHQSPALWPPMHDIPARMTSLHEFWSKGWHQILRDTFLVIGGYPGRWIAGDVGMLFGTFIASGLFHEVGLYLGGAPFDARVLFFFVSQAFGILAEKLFKSVTGRSVGGWGGMLWAAIFVVGIGQMCSE
ncbi:hypothetical protein BN946_scf184798.g61 [Trametes cinnabarina]|uniref:Wax synthase domain-containing protein n=1 Tax=Pycnoporus cinnabarinus TaxID=5643 RepID=A0A060S927_PYCCI|nr:hypothetical protein BN946_scf184798.g61 [Trametes cinnabarina]